jgi:hypothetical protein
VTALQEFRCEVCGTVTSDPIHWFVIRCGNSELTVQRWNSETAQAAGAPALLRGGSRPGVHQPLV